MRVLFPLFALFLLAITMPARGEDPALSVDWSFGEGTNRHAAVITIKNLSGQDLKIQHPGNRQAVAFVVKDEHGNVVPPEGVAKVDPRQQDIVLKAGEVFEHTDSQWTQLAQEKGLTFPFLTGTGLFAHKLTDGSRCRATVIYRPYAEREGVASAEKAVTFK